jgi:hypothetical protein
MFERRFYTSDGQRWRVWAVRPGTVAGERRRTERRDPARLQRTVEPPLIERRRTRDRRAPGDRPTHFRLSHVLPEAWRDGWLVFEPADNALDTPRRLPAVPSDWQECDDRQLEEYFERADRGRRRSG